MNQSARWLHSELVLCAPLRWCCLPVGFALNQPEKKALTKNKEEEDKKEEEENNGGHW